MRIGGLSGPMARMTRSTMKRKVQGPIIQAPPKHMMNLQAEPRRPVLPRPHRKGLLA